MCGEDGGAHGGGRQHHAVAKNGDGYVLRIRTVAGKKYILKAFD
jgi:hypothetical protein